MIGVNRSKLKQKNLLMISIGIFMLLSVANQDKPIIDQFNLNDKSAHRIALGKELKEISGLAVSEDGGLFCQNDEKGIIYQIDLRDGTIIKKFKLGVLTVTKDFEDIAIVGDTFYMVTSSGELYIFLEGKANVSVKYSVIQTGLSKKNNVEGLCYDPETNCLLLACKGYPGKGFKEYKAIYAYSLTENKLLAKPRFLISIKEMEKFSKEKKFEPSGLARHSQSGHFFIIAARGNLIVDISKFGQILRRKQLKEKMHSQPEGIIFKSSNELLICDEGQNGKAYITQYTIDGK